MWDEGRGLYRKIYDERRESGGKEGIEVKKAVNILYLVIVENFATINIDFSIFITIFAILFRRKMIAQSISSFESWLTKHKHYAKVRDRVESQLKAYRSLL